MSRIYYVLHIHQFTASLTSRNGLFFGNGESFSQKDKPQDGAIVKLPRYLAAEGGRV